MKLLPSGKYEATITQARIEMRNGGEWLVLAYTINTGEYAYRNILKKYPLNAKGMEMLEQDMLEIEYYPYTDYESGDDYFIDQFDKRPVNVTVEVARFVSENEGTIKNVIIEQQVSTNPPQYDVTKEKKEDHFHENNKGRRLPLP